MAATPKKKAEKPLRYVYLVKRQSPDCLGHMVEIFGISATKKGAEARREAIFKIYGLDATVEQYLVTEDHSR